MPPPSTTATLDTRTSASSARTASERLRRAAIDACRLPRIAIERLTPAVAPQSGQTFCAKRVVGDVVEVTADVVCDGHEHLSAQVVWRMAGEPGWRSVPMHEGPNDRWRAAFTVAQMGRCEFTVEAWVDTWDGYASGLRKKFAAGVNVALEVDEGRLELEALAGIAAADPPLARALLALAGQVGSPDGDTATRVDVLLSPDTAAQVGRVGQRAYLSRHEPALVIDVERQLAAFASWYELFPRSITDDPARHGTFDDVIGRLPAVAAMGFDVLYFPPIHPIGRTNRKGRNNTLTPSATDPGSPYAIGSEDGGHEAIHPQLGTPADFERLRLAAEQHGLELAIDFAIQCAPDHPWLKAHPEWFAWRPDGTVKYAENPPKKYEDIVNVDFYAEGAQPELWLALRDVVQLWVDRGVKIFRVDNPHTKPFPFWQWLIADIRSRHPEAMFLAEAFTRPKTMYRLAKVGFSQSYTYFTWRNHKAELSDYLVELASGEPREVYRPHFFVNTPDINPYFLQTSGRPGFLIRAALAATLSGLWGMVAGYELCEAEAVPGKEEYLDSDKYEIKPRDWSRPHNIVAEITQLNRIRRANPALHSHVGVRFYNAFNDKILYYGKVAGDNFLLVAVNLDPHHVQECDFEVPLWEFGLPDHASIDAEDLMRPHAWRWRGKMQHLRLDPHDLPFAIWKLKGPVRAVASA